MRDKNKAAYIQTGARLSERLELLKAALESGAKEVHLGWTSCGLCGAQLGEAVESKVERPGTRGAIALHLCDDCWNKYEESEVWL